MFLSAYHIKHAPIESSFPVRGRKLDTHIELEENEHMKMIESSFPVRGRKQNPSVLVRRRCDSKGLNLASPLGDGNVEIDTPLEAAGKRD